MQRLRTIAGEVSETVESIGHLIWALFELALPSVCQMSR